MVELIVVIGIILITVAFASPIYGNLQVSSQMNENTAQIEQALRIARERSIAGLNNSRHGVKFANDAYTIYQGSSFSTRDSSYDRKATINDALSISTTYINEDINFEKGSGLPDQVGTTTLRHRLGNEAKIINNDLGVVKTE